MFLGPPPIEAFRTKKLSSGLGDSALWRFFFLLLTSSSSSPPSIEAADSAPVQSRLLLLLAGLVAPGPISHLEETQEEEEDRIQNPHSTPDSFLQPLSLSLSLPLPGSQRVTEGGGEGRRGRQQRRGEAPSAGRDIAAHSEQRHDTVFNNEIRADKMRCSSDPYPVGTKTELKLSSDRAVQFQTSTHIHTAWRSN